MKWKVAHEFRTLENHWENENKSDNNFNNFLKYFFSIFVNKNLFY